MSDRDHCPSPELSPISDVSSSLEDPKSSRHLVQNPLWSQGNNPLFSVGSMRSAASNSDYQSCSGQSEQTNSAVGDQSNSDKAGSSGSSNTAYVSTSSQPPSVGSNAAAAAAAAGSSNSEEGSPVTSKPGAFYSDALSRFATDVANAGMARVQFLDIASTADPSGYHYNPEADPAPAAPAAAAGGSSASAAGGSSSAVPSRSSSNSGAAHPGPSGWRRSLNSIQEARRSWSQVSVDTLGGRSAVTSASVPGAAAAAAGPEGRKTDSALDRKQKPPRSGKPVMAGSAVDMLRRAKTAAGLVGNTLSLTRTKSGQSTGAEEEAGSSAAAAASSRGSGSSTLGSHPVSAYSTMGGSTIGGAAATAADSAAARLIAGGSSSIGGLAAAPNTPADSTLGGASNVSIAGSSIVGGSTIAADKSTYGGSTWGPYSTAGGPNLQGNRGNDNNSTIGGNNSTIGGNNSTVGGSAWGPLSTIGGGTIGEASSTYGGYQSLAGGSTVGGSSTIGGNGSTIGGYQTAFDGSTIGGSSSTIGGYSTMGGSSRSKGASSSGKPRTWITALINSARGYSSGTSGGGAGSTVGGSSSTIGGSVSTAGANLPVIHTGVLRSTSSSSTVGGSTSAAAAAVQKSPRDPRSNNYNSVKDSIGGYGSTVGGSSSTVGGSASTAGNMDDPRCSHSRTLSQSQKSPRKDSTYGGSTVGGSSTMGGSTFGGSTILPMPPAGAFAAAGSSSSTAGGSPNRSSAAKGGSSADGSSSSIAGAAAAAAAAMMSPRGALKSPRPSSSLGAHKSPRGDSTFGGKKSTVGGSGSTIGGSTVGGSSSTVGGSSSTAGGSSAPGRKSPRNLSLFGAKTSTLGGGSAGYNSRHNSSLGGRHLTINTNTNAAASSSSSGAVQKYAEFQANIQKCDYSSLVSSPRGSPRSPRSPRISTPECPVSLRNVTPHIVLSPKASAGSESPFASAAGSKPGKAAAAAAASSTKPYPPLAKSAGAATAFRSSSSTLKSSTAAAAASGLGSSSRANSGSGWSSCSGTLSRELPASVAAAAAAAVITAPIMEALSYTEAVRRMAAENVGSSAVKQSRSGSESQITISEPNSPGRRTLDRSGSGLREFTSGPDPSGGIWVPAKSSTAGGSSKTSDSAYGSVKTSFTSDRSAAAAGVASASSAAAAAAVLRNASSMVGGNMSPTSAQDDSAAAAAEGEAPPLSPTLWINTARGPVHRSSRGARLSTSDGGNPSPDLRMDDLNSGSGGSNSKFYRRSGSGSGSINSSSKRRSYVAINLGKVWGAGSVLSHPKTLRGRVVLPVLLVLAIVGVAVGTGVAVAKHRSDQAELAAARAAAAAEAESKALAAALDVHHLPFRIDMAVPALDAEQGCRGWFGNSERVSAYRRIFAAAYSSALKNPLPESAVTSIVCGGKTVFNITAEPPPKEAPPAQSLLAEDLEVLERLERAHRILLEMPSQDAAMKMVTVTTRFLVPAPIDMSERLNVVEIIKSQSAAVLSGPMETFFGTPNTWPAGVGQWSDVFIVNDTLPVGGSQKNLSRGLPPVTPEVPALTFQVVIAVPAIDEKQSCAAWFGSSERIGRYTTLFAQAFATALHISARETVIKTVSCGNETIYISPSSHDIHGSSSSSHEPVRPTRLLLESAPAAPAAAAVGDSLTLVEVVTRFTIPGPTDNTPREELAQIVTTQSSKLLSGPLSQFFSVSKALVNLNPMTPKPSTNKSVSSFDSAPTCQFQPTKSNSVADSHGRFWSMQDSKECVFRAQKGAKHQPRKVTWEEAPSCGGKPTQYNSVTDENNRLWGWQGGQSCVFRDNRHQPLGHTIATSGKVPKPTGRIGLVWEAVPTCSAAPTAETSEADTFGRLWGWENDNSCAYRWDSLPS